MIRLKAPLTGETVIDDQVQGRVVWQNENLDDLVLLRSDGTPTYMLAVVVDDHDMDVTHIIRGDDHLTNAARQTQIYQALGWKVPVMAHIPLIHGPDGSKLSKRHGALGVDAYRAMGYLPAAMRNYLVRLGWSHGDQEIFSDRGNDRTRSTCRRSAARPHASISPSWRASTATISAIPPTPIFSPRSSGCCRTSRGGAELTAKTDARLRSQLFAAMPGLKERAKTLVELDRRRARFIFADRPIALDDKAVAVLTAEARS